MNSLTTEASPWPSRPPSYRFRLSRAASLAENGSDNTENGPDETSSIRLPEPAHLEPTARRDSVDSFMPERPGQPPTYDLLAQHRRPPKMQKPPNTTKWMGFISPARHGMRSSPAAIAVAEETPDPPPRRRRPIRVPIAACGRWWHLCSPALPESPAA